jgi:hypothetical protein
MIARGNLPRFGVQGRFQAQPEAKISRRIRGLRQPKAHDPVAEHGKDRRWPHRAESGGDRYERDLYYAQTAGRDREGAGDIRRAVGDRHRPKANQRRGDNAALWARGPVRP